MSTKIFEIMHVAFICGSHFISKDKHYIKELAKQLVCPGENEEKEERKNSEQGANDVLDQYGPVGCHKDSVRGFLGGAVVESLPANAGDTGSSPGLGRSHMPRSN